jgi:heme/copper-type cytochrome/quinol oxidase subunit 3
MTLSDAGDANSRVAADLSGLPTYSFTHRSLMWWGTLGFIAIETSGFGLAIAVYLYLTQKAQAWPPDSPSPDLLPGTVLTVLLLLSLIPNQLIKRWAQAEDVTKTRLGLVLMCIAGLLPLIVRVFEFRALNVSWDTDAYGSIVWTLLGLHTTHLATDVVDTFVLTALMFTGHGHEGRRFSDVDDNGFYWDFVVISWLPVYFILYWFPRLT